jgi:hypothetical protein
MNADSLAGLVNMVARLRLKKPFAANRPMTLNE